MKLITFIGYFPDPNGTRGFYKFRKDHKSRSPRPKVDRALIDVTDEVVVLTTTYQAFTVVTCLMSMATTSDETLEADSFKL